MSISATAATPPPPTALVNGLPPALPSGVLPMTASGGGFRERLGSIGSRFPVKAIIGGVLGAGLGMLLLGPLGAVGGALIGAFIGAKLSNRSPRQG